MLSENVQIVLDSKGLSNENPLPMKLALSGAPMPLAFSGVPVSSENPLPVINATLEEKVDSILAVLGAAADAAGANTVIGQLKQIATNTATP